MTVMSLEDYNNPPPTGNCQAIHLVAICTAKINMRRNATVYLLPQRHPTPQGTGQTDDFSHKCLKSQILLQDHSPQYCLHLGNT